MKWKMQKEYVYEYIKGNVISFPINKQTKYILMKWELFVWTNTHR